LKNPFDYLYERSIKQNGYRMVTLWLHLIIISHEKQLQRYYNGRRVHSTLGNKTPNEVYFKSINNFVCVYEIILEEDK